MYALTVVGIILSVLTLLCALCAAQFKLTVPPLISLIIFALAYIGNQRAIPVLYLPLMVVQVGVFNFWVWYLKLGGFVDQNFRTIYHNISYLNILFANCSKQIFRSFSSLPSLVVACLWSAMGRPSSSIRWLRARRIQERERRSGWGSFVCVLVL